NVVARLDDSGNVISHYAHGLGLSSQVDANNIPAYYTFDAIGNTVGLAGPGGDHRYSYLPFGEVLASSETLAHPLQFGGRWDVIHDGQGLLSMRARSYDPAAGRFTSMDPIGANGGSNEYRYALNNPVKFSDPSGLIPLAPVRTLFDVYDRLAPSLTQAEI